MTRDELVALAKRTFPIGASDGHYLMSEVDPDKHLLTEDTFDGSDDVLEALGFPMGSVHKYAYGLGGDGLHSYRVVSISRTLRLDPRDTTIYYGFPIYQVKMAFHEELTPENFWAKRYESDPFRYERFESPKETLWGCKRLDVNNYGYAVRRAIEEGKPVPARVKAAAR